MNNGILDVHFQLFFIFYILYKKQLLKLEFIHFVNTCITKLAVSIQNREENKETNIEYGKIIFTDEFFI